MKKVIKAISVFSITALALALPFFASAATTDWADTVVSFNQGSQKTGGTIDNSRSDSDMALGANDGTFVSLGYGGDLTLGFPTKGKGTLAITTYEVTNGTTYPLEQADVYVSEDAVNWTMVGVATNEGDKITEIAIDGDLCVQYVKLIDSTDGTPHTNDSDGYDVDAVSFTYDEECLDECPDCGGSDGDDTVTNKNSAIVVNNVGISANTGGNWAGGSYGGSGGEGGDIHNGGEGDVEDSTTGNGGAGANGGDGGVVMTGDIRATIGLTNYVNSNLTEIDRCACGGGDGDIRVRNYNRAIVSNSTMAMLNTGTNMADGSYGGSGGEGGDIYNHGEGDVEESTTGSGATGGAAGLGGYVNTGQVVVMSELVNRINENITRIRR